MILTISSFNGISLSATLLVLLWIFCMTDDILDFFLWYLLKSHIPEDLKTNLTYTIKQIQCDLCVRLIKNMSISISIFNELQFKLKLLLGYICYATYLLLIFSNPFKKECVSCHNIWLNVNISYCCCCCYCGFNRILLKLQSYLQYNICQPHIFTK